MTTDHATRHLFVIVVLGWMATGCGDPAVQNYKEFEDLQPVVGEIDFKGAPIPDATVNLFPVGTRLTLATAPVASGAVDETGKFELFTHRTDGRGRGVETGEYVMTVSWMGPMKGLTSEQIDALKERLPVKYLNPQTSGLKVTIVQGENTLPKISLQ